jgi:hypothetical protein
MARATGKEAIRLWFEFLKRAHHADGVVVNTSHYKAWGDVANAKFERWWKQHSELLFPKRKVVVGQRDLSDSGMVNIAVPRDLTPTEAANQVREVLRAHYAAVGHSPKPQRTYQLTSGAEIKVTALRAYLVTYDANRKLSAVLGLQQVPAKLLLAEVRRVYLAKTHRWRHTKRKVESLPSALAGEIKYLADKGEVTTSGDDTGAERAVRRYLKIANRLVANAAKGDFPSADYYKV